MPLIRQYQAMARYNRWMNDRLYALAAELSDEERKRPMGAFFGSVHGTFNHLLLTDRGWLARFGVGEAPRVRGLADELYADFADLRRERAQTDAALEAYAAALSPEDLERVLTYRTITTGKSMAHPLWMGLTHLFNHQAHHRGQITTLFSQLGRDPGVTDAIVVMQGDLD
jgi:uncharacterized damage-inducible protein DinB